MAINNTAWDDESGDQIPGDENGISGAAGARGRGGDMRAFHRRSGYRRLGFSLAELLVVIGIIAVLMSLLLPAISRARQSSNRTACLSNIHQILTVILMYAGEHQGYLPGPAVPCINDPRLVNVQPGVTLDPAHPDWSQMDVWTYAYPNEPSYSSMELSDMSLLQSYLGGVSYWRIWQCPANTDLWDLAYPDFPTTSGIDPFYLCHLGFGYMVNNFGNWGAAYPNWLFGEPASQNATPSGPDALPKKIASLQATVMVDPNADFTVQSDTKASVFENDSTKVWLISDLDGRNFTCSDGQFGITPLMKLPYTPENIIPQRNAMSWQPVHGGSYGMPSAADPHSGIGRNYGFLDGHAQYLQYGDWPGASVPGADPN